MGDFSETPGWRSPPHPQHQCSGAFARGQGSEKYLLPSPHPQLSVKRRQTQIPTAGGRTHFSLVLLPYYRDGWASLLCSLKVGLLPSGRKYFEEARRFSKLPLPELIEFRNLRIFHPDSWGREVGERIREIESEEVLLRP